MAFATNPDGTTKWIFVQLSGFNGFAVIDFATHKEIKRVKLPELACREGSVPAGRERVARNGAVTSDQKTLIVNSRLNSADLLILAA